VRDTHEKGGNGGKTEELYNKKGEGTASAFFQHLLILLKEGGRGEGVHPLEKLEEKKKRGERTILPPYLPIFQEKGKIPSEGCTELLGSRRKKKGRRRELTIC